MAHAVGVVAIGDDPDGYWRAFGSRVELVDRKDARAGAGGVLVEAVVFGVDLSPVAPCVAHEQFDGRDAGRFEHVQGAGRRDAAAKLKALERLAGRGANAGAGGAGARGRAWHRGAEGCGHESGVRADRERAGVSAVQGMGRPRVAMVWLKA